MIFFSFLFFLSFCRFFCLCFFCGFFCFVSFCFFLFFGIEVRFFWAEKKNNNKKKEEEKKTPQHSGLEENGEEKQNPKIIIKKKKAKKKRQASSYANTNWRGFAKYRGEVGAQPGQGTGRRALRAVPARADFSSFPVPRGTVALRRRGLAQPRVPGRLCQNRFVWNKLEVGKGQRWARPREEEEESGKVGSTSRPSLQGNNLLHAPNTQLGTAPGPSCRILLCHRVPIP